MIIVPVNDAVSVFPPYVNESTGKLVQDQVFDYLAKIDDNLTTVGDKKFTPHLAKSWTWAPDSLSIAFSIDPRARWHDGQPVTANDVRYSFRVFVDPKVGSPTAALMGNIDSVSVRDSLTAVAWFKKRTPEQFYDLAYQLVIMPEHVYGRVPFDQLRTSEVARTPIGSGRFRFVKWEPGVRIELVADTANFLGRPKLDRILVVPADQPTGAVQILSGQADFQDAFPTEQTPALTGSAVARPMIVPNFNYAFMGMNRFDQKAKTQPHPIFADVRVRRALSMAVDREAMLQNVFQGAGRLSHGAFPARAPFADTTLHPAPYDTAAAKALLDSAGWVVGANGLRSKNGRPLRFTLAAPTTSTQRVAYAQMIQAQLGKFGVQVVLDLADFKVVNQKMMSGDFDATMIAFGTDPSPTGVKQNWGTAGISAAGQNFLKYSNPKVDALLDSASGSFDAAKTRAYAARAYQLISDDAPAIFLYDLLQTYAVNRRITMAPMRVDAWWANLADWSIPPEKRIARDRVGLATTKP